MAITDNWSPRKSSASRAASSSSLPSPGRSLTSNDRTISDPARKAPPSPAGEVDPKGSVSFSGHVRRSSAPLPAAAAAVAAAVERQQRASGSSSSLTSQPPSSGRISGASSDIANAASAAPPPAAGSAAAASKSHRPPCPPGAHTSSAEAAAASSAHASEASGPSELSTFDSSTDAVAGTDEAPSSPHIEYAPEGSAHASAGANAGLGKGESPASRGDAPASDDSTASTGDERRAVLVFNELLSTEESYVADLRLLCDLFLASVRRGGCLTKEQEALIFSNCETLRNINEELLKALRLSSAEGADRFACTAAAFGTLSPYLRAYSAYCSNFVSANEQLDKLRNRISAFDAVLKEAEATAGQTAGSMLIKPVQRLCKYPLLLTDIVRQLPDDSRREDISRALETIRAVAEQVNERVREAEARAKLLRLAAALDRQDLVHPARSLIFELEVEAQELASSARGTLGVRGEHQLWLCSDIVLLGRRLSRPPSKAGASFALAARGSLAHASLDSVAVSANGRTALRLTTAENGAVFMLWVKEAREAESLLRAFTEAVKLEAMHRGTIQRAQQLANAADERLGADATPVMGRSGTSSRSTLKKGLGRVAALF